MLVLERGLGETQELARQEITLASGESKALTTPWQTTTNTASFGWEVRAESRAGSTVESSARDFFSVHPQAYFVQIAGGNHRRLDPFRDKESPQNLMEVFAATPGDCAQILPQTDAWVCGMSPVAQSFPIVRAVTAHNRELGVATHMYLFAGGTGEAVMDLHIRRPEWLGGHPNATDQFYYLRSAAREALQKHDFSQGPFSMPKIPHVEVGLNHWFPPLMEQITRAAVEFARRTGYEGIRFDVGLFAPNRTVSVLGEKLPFNEADKMPHVARNFQQFEHALRGAFPNFEFGANMDSWAYLENVGLRGLTPPPPESYPEFVAFARAGGLFMDEGTMSAPLRPGGPRSVPPLPMVSSRAHEPISPREIIPHPRRGVRTMSALNHPHAGARASRPQRHHPRKGRSNFPTPAAVPRRCGPEGRAPCRRCRWSAAERASQSPRVKLFRTLVVAFEP